MKRVTNQASAQRLDAEWKRLCHAVARTESDHQTTERPVVAPAAVRAKALEAWRSSVTRILEPRQAPRDFLVALGILVAVTVLG
jgi:hypothetical protein